MKREIKFCLASVVGTIVYFIVGWFVFEFLLGDYMSVNTINVPGFRRNEGESFVSMLIVSCFAYSALLSFIFTYLTDISSTKKSFLVSAIIGILIAVMADTYWYSTTHFFSSLTPLLLDVAAAGFTVGVMGVSITIVLRGTSV